MASSPASRFPKSARLRKRREFLLVQRRGTRVYTAHFVAVVHRGSQPWPRLGITVTKKVAGAVGRNRVRRVVREVFRRNTSLFPRAELVLIARRGAPELGYAAVLDELRAATPAMRRAAQQDGHSRRRAPGPGGPNEQNVRASRRQRPAKAAP